MKQAICVKNQELDILTFLERNVMSNRVECFREIERDDARMLVLLKEMLFIRKIREAALKPVGRNAIDLLKKRNIFNTERE